ncbi:unnamed protein product [Ranitomeya imitator]|uniref:Uncharacterized protein n=1 Tax=Ranitomeya imitator TaxID=111125 RepID=A0ABN9MJM0_9NEOB|nr:unnamed protein product [Ranitomeya imitator]
MLHVDPHSAIHRREGVKAFLDRLPGPAPHYQLNDRTPPTLSREPWPPQYSALNHKTFQPLLEPVAASNLAQRRSMKKRTSTDM